MKQLLYLLLAGLLFSYTACSDDTSGVDLAWKEANEKAYQKIAEDSDYKELKTETGPSGIYYKVIEAGTETERPIQTSNVKVLYHGMYYDDTVFDKGTCIYNDKGELVERDPAQPVQFSTSGVIRGFSFALQNMVVGDRWDIWIPYYLGYGESGNINSTTGQVTIKGYTTLHFVVELIEIIQYP
jgi:FKBP-type peptidyl-prolyl cis-trans isomerase